MKKEDFLIKKEIASTLQKLGVLEEFLQNLSQDCTTVDLLQKKVRSVNSYPADALGIKRMLGSLFSWCNAPEGFDYWKDVYMKLKQNEI